VEGYKDGNIRWKDVLVEVHTVHVDQVDLVPGECAIDRRLKAPPMPTAVRLTDEGAFRHGSREELSRNQRPGAGNNQRTLTFGNKGRIELGQNPLRAP
jgi:hypothetical protein